MRGCRRGPQSGAVGRTRALRRRGDRAAQDGTGVPSTRSVQRIEENAGAVDVPLTGSDLATIDEILPHGGFGARYSEDYAPVWM